MSTSLLQVKDEVQVLWEWFRDPGAVGGGFWLQETGTVQAVTDTMCSIMLGSGQIHFIPYTGVKAIALIKRP